MTTVNTRPRVAVVYPIPFGHQGLFGGGERYALELARALAPRVPTRLVNFANAPRRFTESGLETRTFQPIRYVGGRNNPLSLRFLTALRDVDVIHCTSWNTLPTDFAILFARAFGKKVFVTDVGGGAGRTLTRRLRLARRVDGFLIIAAAGIGQLHPYRDRTRIIYAGIDTNRYKPDPLAQRSGALFVGRLLPHKGIDTLIEAVSPETPLRIVGHPYHAEYFRDLQRLALGKNVSFITDASDDEVLRYYQTSAVSVLPSVHKNVYGGYTQLPELLGFAAMEAMACATPVVCTRVGGLHELVEEGVSGFLVPPNNPQLLGQRLRLLLHNPEQAANIGAAAQRRIEQEFTWDRVAERCLTAYARVGVSEWANGGEQR